MSAVIQNSVSQKGGRPDAHTHHRHMSNASTDAAGVTPMFPTNEQSHSFAIEEEQQQKSCHAAGVTPFGSLPPTDSETESVDGDLSKSQIATPTSSKATARAFAQLMDQRLPECVDAIAVIAHYTLHVHGPRVDPVSGIVLRHFVAPTPFDSSAVPRMPLQDFAWRICQKTTYDALGMAYGLCLLARWVKVTGQNLTLLNAHRLMLACITVGVKTNCDFFLKNSYLARVGGVALSELNELESRLLNDLHFSCGVTGDEMAALLQSLPTVLDMSWRSPSLNFEYAVATAASVLTGAVPKIERFTGLLDI